MLSTFRFRFIGPATMSGRITDVAVLESDPTTMYIASATGGVWKTTDNAITVTPVFEKQAVHSVGALGLFQGDPNEAFLLLRRTARMVPEFGEIPREGQKFAFLCIGEWARATLL